MAKRRPDLLVDPPRKFKAHVEAGESIARVELIEPGSEALILPREGQ